MSGLRDLFGSERGTFAMMLLAISTAWVVLGKMTMEQWIGFQQQIGISLIISKTVTTAIESRRTTELPQATAMPPKE